MPLSGLEWDRAPNAAERPRSPSSWASTRSPRRTHGGAGEYGGDERGASPC
uniref:Uncharacterized protein n=1 Tax=Setaria italica TaxID=4555 RepID=A0A0Q3VW71_SETIT